MNVHKYIITTVQDTKMEGCKDLVDVMIRRIQDIAVSLFLNDHPPPPSGVFLSSVTQSAVSYVLTYCPYNEEENKYCPQFEGSEADYECAKKYIDAALSIFFDSIVMQGLDVL